jgi:hypothetical protein
MHRLLQRLQALPQAQGLGLFWRPILPLQPDLSQMQCLIDALAEHSQRVT